MSWAQDNRSFDEDMCLWHVIRTTICLWGIHDPLTGPQFYAIYVKDTEKWTFHGDIYVYIKCGKEHMTYEICSVSIRISFVIHNPVIYHKGLGRRFLWLQLFTELMQMFCFVVSVRHPTGSAKHEQPRILLTLLNTYARRDLVFSCAEFTRILSIVGMNLLQKSTHLF